MLNVVMLSVVSALRLTESTTTRKTFDLLIFFSGGRLPFRESTAEPDDETGRPHDADPAATFHRQFGVEQQTGQVDIDQKNFFFVTNGLA
jgi:hypothetical protein